MAEMAAAIGDAESARRFSGQDARLTTRFRKHGNHLQTGFLGTSVLMDTLSEQRASGMAHTLLLNRDVPSWLHYVCEGCMNSFNHYAYGSVLAWMYGRMAGIRPDPKAPGFRHFFLTPEVDGRVKGLKARYVSPHGVIESAWKVDEKGEQSFRFVIPEGTSATVVIPGGRNFELGPGTYEIPERED